MLYHVHSDTQCTVLHPAQLLFCAELSPRRIRRSVLHLFQTEGRFLLHVQHHQHLHQFDPAQRHLETILLPYAITSSF